MNSESRLSAASASCAGHVTTFVEPLAIVGDILLRVENDLRAAGRRLEWAAVQHPELRRTARLAYHASHRLRGDRPAVPA